LKYKTQVFVYHEGDHYRTRLTHTLEVAQITRSIARALMVNEDLAEGIALAHDLGHTPFAHIGEVYLEECMKPYGGFDHNDQSLRVLTTLERKYPAFNGLNLTWETLEGVVKHNGPLKTDGTKEPHIAVRELQAQIDLELSGHASIEAQVAALSDDIAYNNHDVEDGLRAGLFTLGDLEGVSLIKEAAEIVRKAHPDISEYYLIQEMIREMIGMMVNDVLAETKKNLDKVNPQSVDDVRNCGLQIVAFSDEMNERVNELRGFLFEHMYRHYTMNRLWLKVERIIPELFHAFVGNYTLLPNEWQARVEEADAMDDDAETKARRARIVADYIAGMTDRFAIREHARMFDLSFDH